MFFSKTDLNLGTLHPLRLLALGMLVFNRKENPHADTLACREMGVGRPADRQTDVTGLYSSG